MRRVVFLQNGQFGDSWGCGRGAAGVRGKTQLVLPWMKRLLGVSIVLRGLLGVISVLRGLLGVSSVLRGLLGVSSVLRGLLGVSSVLRGLLGVSIVLREFQGVISVLRGLLGVHWWLIRRGLLGGWIHGRLGVGRGRGFLQSGLGERLGLRRTSWIGWIRNSLGYFCGRSIHSQTRSGLGCSSPSGCPKQSPSPLPHYATSNYHRDTKDKQDDYQCSEAKGYSAITSCVCVCVCVYVGGDS